MDLSGIRGIWDTDFSYADLQDAVLGGEYRYDYNRVNFSYANLRGAKLDNACFSIGSDFTGAEIDEKWARIARLLSTHKGEGEDYSNYDLSNVCVFDANLKKAQFYQTDLSDAMLVNANFQQADLEGANLQRAFLDNSIFIRANLENANLTGTSLAYVDLTDAIGLSEEQLGSAKTIECAIMPDGTIPIRACFK